MMTEGPLHQQELPWVFLVLLHRMRQLVQVLALKYLLQQR
jgi:hypothetical protein